MEELFVPALSPAVKHATVFKKFDDLKTGDSLLVINDHDPVPLFYHLKAEKGEVFSWNKIQDGPEEWRVEITRTAEAEGIKENRVDANAAVSDDTFVLNVTLLEPRMKHPAIFKKFDELNAGEGFRILNDHDPRPLYYQMIAERGNIFSWAYIQSGPQWWEVEIRKNEKGQTIGEIAAGDLRKAEVFKKYGIDFCCGGKKSLQEACRQANVDPAVVEAALNSASTDKSAGVVHNFQQWEPDFLADYIYNQHHVYYYQEGPVIKDLADKVAARHGEHFPVLHHIVEGFRILQHELQVHFLKEEKILFPFIKALVKAKRTNDFDELNSLPSIKEPVQVMEMDHESAGEILAQLRRLTNDFTPPQGACNSFQLLYGKLSALEEDLHQHVHLENNILFPKALALEKELLKN